jgi:NAD(P)-dependent dehydrogenase (short-subunit alcohol dehydrogenase family)
MSSLKGKTILVTGASSGIGLAASQLIAAQGGSVVGIARNATQLQAAIEKLDGSGHRAIQADLSECESFEELVAKLPQIQGVVHSAGDPHTLAARDLSRKVFEKVFSVHLYAPNLLTVELIRQRKLGENGSVVFLSSLAAKSPAKGMMAYAIAKAGLLVSARSLTAEYSAKFKIRFNSVLPGMIDTPFQLSGGGAFAANVMARESVAYPFGIGKPESVAGLIAFLLSDASEWITGGEFLVDGGRDCIV